nr:L,D-transpeptidase [Legionella yabuuchiae]
MNRKQVVIATALSIVASLAMGKDEPVYYGSALCKYPQYECVRVGHSQSWERMFPDERERDLVQRLNRTYNYLWAGKVIAVPKDLKNTTWKDISPFPLKIKPEEKTKQIIVDQDKLAYGAYDEEGNLVKWGPISSGSDRCSDNSSPTCRTKTGIFRVFSMENEKCKSNVFPLGRGGAKMPYCMYFHKGLALHGSDDIPGYRASHGCIRMFTRDAKWLNHHFVETSKDSNSFLGTKVIVRPLASREKK